MKEVGAEKRLAGLLEQHTRIPAMRYVWRAIEPVAILAGGQQVFRRHAVRRADGEIIYAHKLADESADGLGLGRNLKPIVERADIGIVTVRPPDPTHRVGVGAIQRTSILRLRISIAMAQRLDECLLHWRRV